MRGARADCLKHGVSKGESGMVGDDAELIVAACACQPGLVGERRRPDRRGGRHDGAATRVSAIRAVVRPIGRVA